MGIKRHRGESPRFSRGMNPTRSSHSLPSGSRPEFPRWRTRASTAPRLCRDSPRGNKSDTSPRRTGLADANRGTVRAKYPAVEGRSVNVPKNPRPRVGRKAALTRLHALHSTPSVTIGRQPLTWDAKADFATEDTRNLELPFGESHDFSRARMSRCPIRSCQEHKDREDLKASDPHENHHGELRCMRER